MSSGSLTADSPPDLLALTDEVPVGVFLSFFSCRNTFTMFDTYRISDDSNILKMGLCPG